MQKLIDKAIKHYKYKDEVGPCDDSFIRKYNNFTDKDTLKNHPHILYKVLNGNPDCTHIKAKSLLFQGKNDCWKYFERTAVFWVFSHMNDEWIDHSKGIYEYSLYVEREDLIQMLLEKSLNYLTDKNNLSSREFQKQQVYPSTQLVHFLIEKWLGENPVKELILEYGEGYGIYQKIVDNWEDFSSLESTYWDELCEYHLNRIGLQSIDKYEYEEFLSSGLVPMELINLIKVREKLGLDMPGIDNEFFSTNMAMLPVIPTGYNENFDLKFKLIDLTIQKKKKHTFQEIESYITEQNGEEFKIFK